MKEKKDEEARVRREALSGGGADGWGLFRGWGVVWVGAWFRRRRVVGGGPLLLPFGGV